MPPPPRELCPFCKMIQNDTNIVTREFFSDYWHDRLYFSLKLYKTLQGHGMGVGAPEDGGSMGWDIWDLISAVLWALQRSMGKGLARVGSGD